MFELSCSPVERIELQYPKKGESLNAWLLFAPAGYVRLSLDRLQALAGFFVILSSAEDAENLSYGEFPDSPCGVRFGRWWYHLHTRTQVPIVDHFVPARERETLLSGSMAEVPGLLATLRSSITLFHRARCFSHTWQQV